MLDVREEGDIDSERDEGEGGSEERGEGRKEDDRNVGGEGEEESDECHAGSDRVNRQASSPTRLDCDRVSRGAIVPNSDAIRVASGRAVAISRRRLDSTVRPHPKS